MDTKFKSSFIPRTIPGGKTLRQEKGAGALYYFGILVFLICLLGSGGLFLYKKLLVRDIDNLKSQIASAQASLDMKSIEELVAYDNKLKSVQTIISGHTSITQYLEMLEDSTVSQVQFNSLKYSSLNGAISVEMGGQASSYGAIALQEDILTKNPLVKSANFDSLKLKADTGDVTFVFRGEFDRELVKFKVPQIMAESEATTTAQ